MLEKTLTEESDLAKVTKECLKHLTSEDLMQLNRADNTMSENESNFSGKMEGANLY
jgi:hypothetical protein